MPALIERLEDRTLLAGNVLVEIAGADVLITGDAQDNSVAVSVVGGDIRVQGLDGTQVNGSSGPFVLIPSGTTIAANLRIRLGAGSDTFLVAPGITVQGEATIDGGDGDDQLGLESAQITGGLTIRTGAGNDGVSLDNVTVAGSAHIQDEAGELVVSIEGGSIGSDLNIYSSAGEVDVVLDTITVARNTVVKTLRGDANVVVLDSQFDNLLSVFTGGGNDFVFVETTGVDSTARFKLGSGVDSIVLEGTSQFGGNAVIIGGDGGDAVRLASANNFSSPPRRVNIEINSVLQSFVDLRLSDPVQGALPRAAAVSQIVVNLLAPTLVIDVSGNAATQSNGTLLTDEPLFEITGTTEAGATITLDRDGDGQFDDGSVVAAADGTFTIDANLLTGPNPVRIRSTSAGTGGARTLVVDVHRAEGTVVRFETSLGSFDVELFDDDAPLTVANFLDYFDRYGDTSFVHRSIDAFVIQGGGFFLETNGEVQVEQIDTDPPIPNEFNPANSNLRGTLSTALVGGNINSATSQWFVNTVDNLFLDEVPHTVFGRVIGTGMDVVDAINDTPTFNLNGVFPESALSQTPLVDYTPFTLDLAGTVTVQSGSVLVTGTGTSFTTALRASQGGSPGSAIRIGNQVFTVASIIDNTRITLNRPHPTGATNATAEVNAIPDADSFVVFSNIAELPL